MFLTYFESGRVAMFRDPDLGIGVPGITFVLVRMEVDYMKESHWPGQLDIGTGVAEFGRTSFKAAQAIFHDGVCSGPRPRHAGLHGFGDAQGDADPGGSDRAADAVEDEGRLKTAAQTGLDARSK